MPAGKVGAAADREGRGGRVPALSSIRAAIFCHMHHQWVARFGVFASPFLLSPLRRRRCIQSRFNDCECWRELQLRRDTRQLGRQAGPVSTYLPRVRQRAGLQEVVQQYGRPRRRIA